MTPRKGNLMGVRTDIKVLDATIRDGGLCNNFDFSDEFVRELYKTNIKSGVDYMEFGYKASRTLFNEADFGKWKFCKEEDIRAIVGENVSDMKISVMADVGRCDFKTDFLPRSESAIDMVRVACYIHQIPAAIEMIEYFHDLGYETTCNIMAISQAGSGQVGEALEMLCNSSVDVIYLVDSYGSLYPENAGVLAQRYLEAATAAGKQVGFHAHNNQNLAFANTIETLSYGVSYLDATAMGMGRGAGNCAMELLLGFLKNPKYSLYSLLIFIEKYMIPLRESGVQWGFDLQYMFTGQLNRHPREAMNFTAQHRTDYCEFYKSLLDNDYTYRNSPRKRPFRLPAGFVLCLFDFLQIPGDLCMVNGVIPEVIFFVPITDGAQHAAGVAHRHYIGGNVLGDHRPGADDRVVANGHPRQDDCSGADPAGTANVHRHIVLVVVLPQLRQHRVAGGGDGHIGGDHGVVADINMGVVHHGNGKVAVHMVAQMHMGAAEVRIKRGLNIAVLAQLGEHLFHQGLALVRF